VSLSAQAFFEHFGFHVVERRSPVIRGVALDNALMRKHIVAGR
jgi:putative acetyltransferase